MKTAARYFLPALLILCMSFQIAYADVTPGDTIDKTNYQKIEGLVPDYIVTWVKDGDMTMKIGKLTYNPKAFWPPEVLENWQPNIGKYKIDENNGIVDAKTMVPVRGIKGLPFPEPDMNDPKIPVMLMWNNIFCEYFIQGNVHENKFWLTIKRKGLEKKMVLENLSLILDPDQSKSDYSQLSIFREPFNMSGTGTLAFYPLNPLKNGARFAWSPELRKVRRMSHRLAGSDVHFGFDGAPDDTWTGGPKTAIEEGEYRFIKEKEALVPYFSESPRKVDWNEKKAIEMGYTKTGEKILLGFDSPEWKGAPWHVMDLVWVKSKVWVFESKSTSSNYGYGPCEGWVEQGSFSNCYKRITDVNGQLWKGFYWPAHAIQTKDDTFRLVYNAGMVLVDVRRDHGSAYCNAYREGGYKRIMKKDMNEKLFTRAGFVKFSK